MPTSFCVPECTKKGYLDENGRKLSHFKFPDDPLWRKNGFTLLEEMRHCSVRYRDGLKFAQGILESMNLSRCSAVGEICDRMLFHHCFLRLKPLLASWVLLFEIKTVEETIETENATRNEASETSDIDAINKQDVVTQINEIESTDSSETEMNQC